MSIGQYIKDTQAEMRHVAWPTRTQTVVFTVLVVLFSIAVALYVGFFDFLFTRALEKALMNKAPSATPSAAVEITSSSTPEFTITPGGLIENIGVTTTPETN
jgi:preprotein translocase SecE subunit